MKNDYENYDLNTTPQNPYSYQKPGASYPPQMPQDGMGYPPQMPYGNMGYPSQMPYGGMGYSNQMPYGSYGNMPGYDPGKGKGIASMILGIASILTMCTFYGVISFICGIIGLVLSKLSEKASGYQRNGFATAGLICSVIGISISLLWFILFAFAFNIAWINTR